MTTLARDFRSANASLQGRNAQRRKVGNNTYLVRRGACIAVQLHDTDVVTYFPDGRVMLNTGGWGTVTTRDRINTFAPVRMHTERGVQWVASKGKVYRYQDGIMFGPRGACLNPPARTATAKADKAKAALRAKIDRYIDGWIDTAVTGQMPLPSGGDCWYCAMFPESPGEGASHLAEHLSEDYFVPSLIVKAARARGYGNPGVAVRFIMGLTPGENETHFAGTRVNVKEVRHLLRWYLRKHLR